MKLLLLFPLSLTLCCVLNAQTTWHVQLPGGFYSHLSSQVSVEEGQYFIRTPEGFMNVNRFGDITGSASHPVVLAASLKKRLPGTDDPYFILASRTLQGTTGYTLKEYRTGSGYSNPLSISDSLGSLAASAPYRSPWLFELKNNVIGVFGGEYFRKFKALPGQPFLEISSLLLPNRVTCVVRENGRFVVADDAGRVYAIDIHGNELWSATHSVVFRTIRSGGDGFIACASGGILTQLAADGTHPGNYFQLSTGSHPPGLYWLELWQDGKFLGRKKLVLNGK